MDWLKKHYDRVILAAMGLVVLVCAALIIISALGFNETFATRNSAKRPSKDVPSPGTQLVNDRIAAIENPKDWGVHDGSIFVSRPYVSLDGGDPVDPTDEGQPDLFKEIPNKWIATYNLDFANPKLPDQDPDGDKFSNREEFAGKTDPTNPKSMPPFYTKLRLLEFIQVPFRLKFSGSPEEGTYSINTLDLRGPTQFLKIGEKIAGTPYKLVKYDVKTDSSEGYDKDISELTIENEDTAEKIVLVNDKPVNDPTVYARIKYLWDGTEYKVKKLESFSFKPEETIKYKLIDISDTQAVIESPQGTKITVSKATE